MPSVAPFLFAALPILVVVVVIWAANTWVWSQSPPVDKKKQRKKRVAVIGAGPSGLCTARELLAEGHDVVVFESGDKLGGAFAKAYHGAKLTSSNFITSFSSMQPEPTDTPTHWTAGEYQAYLTRYSASFMHKIRFGVHVQSVAQAPSGSWVVTVAAGEGSAPAFQDFDCVAVCCGTHQAEAATPELKRKLAGFTGTVLHSSEYTSAKSQLAGKRVLVVGLGESGSDISLQAARVATATAISTRSGPGYIIPRNALGSVADLDTSRAHHSIHQGRLGWSTALTELQLQAKMAVEQIVERWWIRGQHPEEPSEKERMLASKINDQIGLPWYRRFGTKNMAFCRAIVEHGAEYKPDIAGVSREDGTVTFVDGSTFKCDVILLCTGYKVSFPFLAPEVANRADRIRADLFKHMVHPELGTSIAWIGFCRPGVGSIPPLAEMQARYWALLLSGTRALPSVKVMSRVIAEDDERVQAQYPRDAKRIAPLCDYLCLLDGLAHLIGCAPPRFDVRHPRRSFKVMFGPITGAQYRLRGPGATPRAARVALLAVPTVPLPIVLFNMLALAFNRLRFGGAAR